MILVGLDYSMNAPGIMKGYLNKNFNIINIKYRGFTTVAKTAKSDKNLRHHHNKQFSNHYQKALWMREQVCEFIMEDGKPDYLAIEGYSFGSTGIVFDIAESTVCTKIKILEDLKIPLRIYEPSTIKKFAGVSGKTKKVAIGDAYIADESPLKPNLNHLTPYISPSEDLVDSYYVLNMLHTEIRLRYGIIELKSLPLKQIEIFNRTTKSNPENILVRDFITV